MRKEEEKWSQGNRKKTDRLNLGEKEEEDEEEEEEEGRRRGGAGDEQHGGWNDTLDIYTRKSRRDFLQVSCAYTLAVYPSPLFSLSPSRYGAPP